MRYNNVRAAIKLQFRDVDSFIHKDFRNRQDIRYIKKTLDTRMSKDDFAELVEAIRRNNCIRMATPFDETSVDLCEELGIEIIKIASSDINDWVLLEKIAKTRKPVIVSTGGSSVRGHGRHGDVLQQPQHPARDQSLRLALSDRGPRARAQPDRLPDASLPGVTIGLSTHEYRTGPSRS